MLLKDLIEVADNLNNVLGLKPPINTDTADTMHLEKELLSVANEILVPEDNISSKSKRTLKRLGFVPAKDAVHPKAGVMDLKQKKGQKVASKRPPKKRAEVFRDILDSGPKNKQEILKELNMQFKGSTKENRDKVTEYISSLLIWGFIVMDNGRYKWRK